MKEYVLPFLGMASCLSFYSCKSKQTNSQNEKPNIIYILADDMGYSDLGCYGSKKVLTPNIDQMAKEGMRFTRHYAGTSVCAPSRCSLMTGLHTGHCQVRGNAQHESGGQMPLAENTQTVARLLHDAGYNTALIGKWGLGDPGTTGEPTKQGFDQYFGYTCQVYAHNHYPEFLIRNGEKEYIGNKVVYRDSSEWHGGRGSYTTQMVQNAHHLFTNEAIEFIEKNQTTPFFIYLAVVFPHDNGEAEPGKRYELPSYQPYDTCLGWSESEKGYAAQISLLDAEVGKIMNKLQELKLDENTLVIFTSDNGGDAPGFFLNESNGNLRGIKRDMYEGGLRVPFIAHWKGTIAAGTINNHVSAFWDFLPTACDIAGIKQPVQTDGISYLPALLGREQTEHVYLYWEFHEQGKKQAVLQGDWKGIRLNVAKNPNGPIELYNLTNDPSESSNIAKDHPDIVAKFDSLMKVSHTHDPNWSLISQ